MPHSQPRSVDREALIAIRHAGSAAIGDLVDSLGVTATAVRQRVDRLLDSGLIEREKCVSGRGRPTYQYRLTFRGQQAAGARLADLADALWHEVLALADVDSRERILAGAARRMGALFAAELSVDGEDPDTALQRLSQVLAARQVDASVTHPDGDDGLPVLDIGVCPYPSLTAEDEDRSMCRMEEQMLSEAMGHPMHLSSCRLDGDNCCQFTTSGSAAPARTPDS